MHSKIINPSLHGRGVYENKGSSGRLVVYLQHEAKEKGVELTFFQQEREGISAEVVQHSIDHNIKGLRSRESKFIALILSPSEKELRHIDNDPEKLKAFTRVAMQQYASEFRLKEGKKIGSEDLVWFATIHQNRTYKGTDREVKEGRGKSGELKSGLNMHVHVIVSKRDREQKITLSPFGNRNRFDIEAWQRSNEISFSGLFQYHSQEKIAARQLPGGVQMERMQASISGNLERINGYLGKAHELKLDEVLEVAQRRAYHKTFFLNLSRLEYKLREGKYVRDPMHLLEHNRDRKPLQIKTNGTLAASLQQLTEASRNMGFTERLWLQEFAPRKRQKKGLFKN